MSAGGQAGIDQVDISSPQDSGHFGPAKALGINNLVISAYNGRHFGIVVGRFVGTETVFILSFFFTRASQNQGETDDDKYDRPE